MLHKVSTIEFRVQSTPPSQNHSHRLDYCLRVIIRYARINLKTGYHNSTVLILFLQQVPFAYKMFTRDDEIGWAQSNAFKKAFSIDVDIEFVGVWGKLLSCFVFVSRAYPCQTR